MENILQYSYFNINLLIGSLLVVFILIFHRSYLFIFLSIFIATGLRVQTLSISITVSQRNFNTPLASKASVIIQKKFCCKCSIINNPPEKKIQRKTV